MSRRLAFDEAQGVVGSRTAAELPRSRCRMAVLALDPAAGEQQPEEVELLQIHFHATAEVANGERASRR